MNKQSAAFHQHTPLLTTFDPRGLTVRSVAWCRTQPADSPESRVNRSVFNAAGRVVSSWDPRLWADQAQANFTNVHALSGEVLCSDSVDAGWRVSLPGEGGELLAGWDGRGTERRLEYDALLRPTAIFENDQCLERLQYGDADAAAQNQCGRLVRHDDPAGMRRNIAFGLTGAVLEQTQYFLADLDDPDWPALESERDALLEPGAGASTHWAYTPLGEVIRQTDALGNVQAFAYTVAGQLKAVAAQLKEQTEQILVSHISYDAQGRVASETAGNGVITRARYRDEDGRLIELNATRNNGEHLQDWLYDYDPVGNVIRIEDRAQPTRFFANQRIEPVSSYQYDTLYQLIEATGREAATVNHGPAFPEFQSPADPTQLANYTQIYRYDAGGNLQQLTHVGAQAHSRTLVTARTSNRSLPVVNDQPPDEETIAAAFDANGNLLELQAGQVLSWDRRNQLQQVRPVVRETADDDSERYLYDTSGQRLRKVSTRQAKKVSHHDEVRYLPGLEIRTNSATGETLQVICAQAGRNGVRVLHWQAGKPAPIANDQYRYTLNDHLGSGTLELDNDAQIISQESYYPFGGTSCWAGRNAIEASYKTVRYSGKERDATGLYYYGLRYYAPWLQRWINPDPVGVGDGLNMYRAFSLNPINNCDRAGCNSFDVLNDHEMHKRDQGMRFLARGLNNFPTAHHQAVKTSMTLGREWLTRTARVLGNGRADHFLNLILKYTFGQDVLLPENDPDGLKGILEQKFIRLEKFIDRLENAESWRILLVETVTEEFGGITVHTAAQGNMIWLNKSFIENTHPVGLTKTFVHESTHALPILGGGLDTSDFWYVTSFLPDSALTADVESYMETAIARSEQASVEAPEEAAMESFDRDEYRAVIDKMLTDAGFPQSANAQVRADLFVSEAAVRQSVIMRNADSLAAFALQFHRLN